MYPVPSSQIAPRTDERRRKPRFRTPSIVYAQLGSDNGGIVVNLAPDGVACHAAQKFIAEKNATLNIRLRGSGLNADVVGELIWVGSTQREVGISFKSLSTSDQKGIADWIALQAQPNEPTSLQERSQSKPMPVMPDISAPTEKTIPRSLSAALAISQAIPGIAPSSVDAGAVESSFPPPLVSASEIPGTTPIPEFVPPAQQISVPPDESGGHEESLNSEALDDSSADIPMAEPQAEQALPIQPVPEPSPVGHPDPAQAQDAPAEVFSKDPMPLGRAELAQASAVPPGKNTFSSAENIAAISWNRFSRRLDRLFEGETAERWIPPALLAAWRRGNGQHRLLLAGAATACCGIFALILTLAVAHVASFWGKPQAAGPPQRSSAPPAASVASVNSVQTVPVQAPSATPARRPTPPPEPQPSLLEDIESNLFGKQPGPIPAREISPDQLHVKVWTSKSSGYYYCTDDAYYKSVQPGTFMDQSDALQSGYQPILGDFCN